MTCTLLKVCDSHRVVVRTHRVRPYSLHKGNIEYPGSSNPCYPTHRSRDTLRRDQKRGLAPLLPPPPEKKNLPRRGTPNPTHPTPVLNSGQGSRRVLRFPFLMVECKGNICSNISPFSPQCTYHGHIKKGICGQTFSPSLLKSRSFCTFEPPYSKRHRVGLLQALVPPYSFWGFRRGLVCGYSYPTFIRANMEKGPCPRVLAPYSTPSRLVE